MAVTAEAIVSFFMKITFDFSEVRTYLQIFAHLRHFQHDGAFDPFFVELAGASGLVAGGGKVALRKVEKLLPYGPRLTVIAPRIDEKILAMPGVVCLRRAFEPADLEGKEAIGMPEVAEALQFRIMEKEMKRNGA